MKVELFPFQEVAASRLRNAVNIAGQAFYAQRIPQVISFTAPTGAGKTVILANLIEDIYYGNEIYPEQPEAIFVWLSDSPELNEQSRNKIDLLADKVRLDQCVTVSDESFDRETFEEGHIYFLNTQKLGKNSNLTRHSDSRQYTIWETLQNTLREKTDHFYVLIDEAHRGMQGRKAGQATTIMQKFIKGSVEDGLDQMPVVVGMSATTERFNTLVGNTSSTIQKVVVTADDVRASGLLKDRIIITYPEETSINKDMAVLQAAADDWKDKWIHWEQYCREQHYAYINPIFVVQVQNGNNTVVSTTDLDDCLQKIEVRTGFHFDEGEVVHTFGQTEAAVIMNGLKVPYVEPSRIADDMNIKVVFFKENLSTGWDCPRAETMMSFRHATDATYIAQLLGRMVRTPRQSRIQVDETLNDVHLYLPYFDRDNVKKVVEALQSEEGGTIPTEIQGELMGHTETDVLTIKPVSKKPKVIPTPGQLQWTGNSGETQEVDPVQHVVDTPEPSAPIKVVPKKVNVSSGGGTTAQPVLTKSDVPTPSSDPQSSHLDHPTQENEPQLFEDGIDREAVVKTINELGLLTYDVRQVQISNYLNSMFKLAHVLSQSGREPLAVKSVVADVVAMIGKYIATLKQSGEYDSLVDKPMQFKMSSQIFDIFGESVDGGYVYNLFSTTDTDIDRQFRLAETKLGREGVGNEYGRQNFDPENPNRYKIDVILFASNDECLKELNAYAKDKFHELDDTHRKYMITVDERFRQQYERVVSDGDVVSKHNFRLPETINVPHEQGGKAYAKHLYANEKGMAHFKLNGWEEGTLLEEMTRDDFVCWVRNASRKSWALCIPYQQGTTSKAMYPDFLIVRKDAVLGYIVDILEPHNPDFDDNLPKAQGLAEYARQNQSIGRIQLIRKGKDLAGKSKFKRLDLSKSAIRDRVLKAISNDELDHIFDEDGEFLQ